MDSDDSEFEFSPLMGTINHDGVTVAFRIYRFASPGEQWQLEVIAPDGAVTSWDDLFETDEDALKAFFQAIREQGFHAFLEPAATHH